MVKSKKFDVMKHVDEEMMWGIVIFPSYKPWDRDLPDHVLDKHLASIEQLFDLIVQFRLNPKITSPDPTEQALLSTLRMVPPRKLFLAVLRARECRAIIQGYRRQINANVWPSPQPHSSMDRPKHEETVNDK